MKKEIDLKTTAQHKIICETLKLDTERLRDIELKMETLTEINKKTDIINTEVKKLRHLEDDVFQTNCFLERVLPMQIHHQLCEGLNSVAGPDLEELLAFEKEKSIELYKYSR